jgi:putative glutamine amidotransferase
LTIGLTYTGSDKKHQYYQQWLEGNDKNIQVIRLSEEINNDKDIKHCDALVLSGGIDINPKYYEGDPDYPNKPQEGWNDLRDNFESRLFRSALDLQLPVLGICRGLQLINVLLDGTLSQDLGDSKGNLIHEGSPDKQHPVETEKDSLLYNITGVSTGVVNSAHHQAINKLGKGLKINSRAPDGTIEGIEWADSTRKPFLLGIQWHAERMFVFNLQDSPFSANIRTRFINEIIKSTSSIQ